MKTTIIPCFLGNKLARTLSYAKLNQAEQSGAELVSCSSSAGRGGCRAWGSTAPRCPASPSSPSGLWRRTRPPHYHFPLLRPPLEGEMLKPQTGEQVKFVWVTRDFPRLKVPGLTHQRVHVPLGIVEESSVTTHQVKGIHQVRPAQVLRRCHGLRARWRHNH